MKHYLSLVKFSHTVFALPFALTGFFIATRLHPNGLNWVLLALVLLCMVFARNAAMAFNRWLDRDIDAANPRTVSREIPAGVISSSAALAFVVFNAAAFVATTWFINGLCFALSPVALLVILGYSYTKRFTWLCHVVLGLGLALAPVGAYLAVAGRFDWIPVLLGFAVLTWVAGFDMIYALQDEEFDRERQLYSMPAFLGKSKALMVSTLLHVLTGLLLIATTWLMGQDDRLRVDVLLGAGTALFLGILVYQHLLVKPNDLSRVNMAFFTTNGIGSVAFGALAIIDLLT